MLMPCDTLNIDRDGRSPDGEACGSLSVFQIMPRNMFFGGSGATSIDLCVHDLVSASRLRATTTIFAEKVEECFSGFRLDELPPARRAATFARANHVARAARRERPDLVIVQQHLPTAAAIARRLAHAKIILHTHNFQKAYETSGGASGIIHRAVRKHRYARLAGIIHVSNACAQKFAEAWPDVAIPSAVVSNGLDFAAWRPARDRAKEILCVGRCAPEKGILEAAEAVATVLPNHPEWRARFILSNVDVHPDYFRRTRAALAVLGPQAEIELQRPFTEIKTAFERAAIALVPSKWAEPFGRTALEAHAGGAALISSGTGGLAEISGEAALTLPAVTPDAIGCALEALIVHEAMRHRLAQEGEQRARALFGIAAQAARLDAFYETVVRGCAQEHRASCDIDHCDQRFGAMK